jgi:hypothetical protein
MKATKIYYKKLFNLGNYENEEVGIEIELEGEKAADVLEKAKLFVNDLNPSKVKQQKYQDALNVLANKEGYSYKRVIEAEEFIKEYDLRQDLSDEIPF